MMQVEYLAYKSTLYTFIFMDVEVRIASYETF